MKIPKIWRGLRSGVNEIKEVEKFKKLPRKSTGLYFCRMFTLQNLFFFSRRPNVFAETRKRRELRYQSRCF